MAFRKQEKKDAKAKLLRISASEHGIHPNQICEKTKDVLQRLTKAGYEAYLVGGAVRDLMLGKQPKDFDIATSASPEQVRRVFSRSCRLIGRRFRLAHIYYGRFYLEVATFRAPHDESGKGLTANDGRIIHDNVYGTLEQDALRRDFTINALFYDLETGDVLDYVSGVEDLRAGKLRLIGDPEQRYREDPVRMLRAIRFSSKLDLQIDESAKAPIQEMAHLLDNIAPARLFDESLKLFHSGQAAKTLDQLRDHQLFFHLFPLTEMGLHDENFYNFVKLALSNTDKRIRSGLSVTPAFLYAVMLWRGVQKYAQDNIDLGQAPHQAYHVAASEILKEQAQTTGIPRRFAQMSRDIWTLQTRFIYRDCRRSMNFLTNNRFRAAYDFYCLRTATEDDLDEESCQWWTDFQKGNDKHKLVMCRPFKKGSRRHPRKKKPQNNAK